MKTKLIAAFVLATVFAAPAFADNLNYPAVSVTAAGQASGVTRAQVRAQLAQIEKAGYNPAADSTQYPSDIEAAEAKLSGAAAGQASGLTRAQVRAQLAQIEKAGYNPGADGTQYPNDIEAAEARVAMHEDVASNNGGAHHVATTFGTLASASPTADRGTASIYFGS